MVGGDTDELIHIACGIDGDYVPHCATMLQSLVASNPNRRFHVHVMYGSGVVAPDLERLKQYLENHGCRVSLCRPEDQRLESLKINNSWYSMAVWYRLLLADLLPEVRRVLYLDCDLLVVQDIGQLLTTDLQGAPLAAVRNIFPPGMGAETCAPLGIECARNYFNTGVMLLDLESFRQQGIVEQVIAYAKQHPDNCWHPEQDPMNAVLWRKWRGLPLEWNAQSALYEYPASRLDMPVASLASARDDPAIIHFTGQWKPWHFRCRHPRRYLYARYRMKTPWSEWQIYGKSFRNYLLRLLPYDWSWTLEQWRNHVLRRP